MTFEIEENYEAPAAAGKYDEDAAAFVKAYNASENKKIAGKIIVTVQAGADEKAVKAAVAGHVRAFQTATHRASGDKYSAVVSGEKVQKGNEVTVRFVLTDRRTREVKPAEATETEATEAAS